MKRTIILALVLLAQAAFAGPIVIRDTTVLAPKPLPGVDVVIDEGTIVSVSRNAPTPRGATVIDGRGKFVTPGLIDPATSVGLIEVSQVAAANDGTPNSASDDKVHAAYRVIDGYNDASMAIAIARLGGVTTVGASPRGSLISGQAALMSLNGKDAKAATLRASAYMVASLDGQALGDPPSRGVVIERFREILTDARAYARAKARFDRNQMRHLAAERLDLEALARVLSKEIPMVVRAHRASDIRAAIRIAADERIRIIIAGGAEAWVVADELAKAQIPVWTDPLMNLPSSFDRVRSRNENVALLARAGVTTALSTLGSAASVRRLRQLAGNAVALGLTPEQALAAITSVPAAILGLDDRGTVAPGKVADLVLWSGDPLELSSRAELILIGGESMPLKSRQTLLLDRYR